MQHSWCLSKFKVKQLCLKRNFPSRWFPDLKLTVHTNQMKNKMQQDWWHSRGLFRKFSMQVIEWFGIGQKWDLIVFPASAAAPSASKFMEFQFAWPNVKQIIYGIFGSHRIRVLCWCSSCSLHIHGNVLYVGAHLLASLALFRQSHLYRERY